MHLLRFINLILLRSERGCTMSKVKKLYKEKWMFLRKISIIFCLIMCLPATIIPVVSAAGINQGWIQIISNVDGASVYFDDNYQGQTYNGQLVVTVYMATPVGRYRVEKPGFTNVSGTLTMPDAGATTISYATLRPISTPSLTPSSMHGSISVDTSPGGAKIYLDGYYRGFSPINIDQISPGSHTVEADLKGYYTYTTMLEISAGTTKNLYFTLQEITSSPNILYITSDPTHAFVYFDSIYHGKTPLTLKNVRRGSHEISLINPGYEIWNTSINFPSNGSTRTINATMISLPSTGTTIPVTVSPIPTPPVTAPLTPAITTSLQPPGNYGSISVSTSPQGASVYVDGEMKGVTPTTIPGLIAGNHTVLFVSPGYLDLNATITVSAGKTAEYSTSLVAPAKTPGFGVIAAVLSIGGLLMVRKIRK